MSSKVSKKKLEQPSALHMMSPQPKRSKGLGDNKEKSDHEGLDEQQEIAAEEAEDSDMGEQDEGKDNDEKKQEFRNNNQRGDQISLETMKNMALAKLKDLSLREFLSVQERQEKRDLVAEIKLYNDMIANPDQKDKKKWDGKSFPTASALTKLNSDGSNLKRYLQEAQLLWKTGYGIPTQEFPRALLRLQEHGSVHWGTISRLVQVNEGKKDAWEAITKELFMAYGRHNTLFHEQTRMNLLRQKRNQSVLEFITEFENQAIDCEWDLDSPSTAYDFVNKLQKQHKTFVIGVGATKDAYTFEDAKKWAKISEINKGDSDEEGSQGNKSTSHRSVGKTCQFCKKTGHLEDECFKKNPSLRTPKPITTSTSPKTTSASSKQHIQCHKCKVYGHYADKCPTLGSTKTSVGSLRHQSVQKVEVLSDHVDGESTDDAMSC